MKKKIIVIDPGHGGSDPGAMSGSLIEKVLTLEISHRVVKKLSVYEADIHLTRESDNTMALKDRAEFANKMVADFFLSIHYNAGGGEGFESYVFTGAPAFTLNIRKIIHQEMNLFFQDRGIPDRGMKAANFAVLRLTQMSSVLLELLFIDNPRDVARIKNNTFLDAFAAAISAAVVKTMNLMLKKEKETTDQKTPGVVWKPLFEIEKLKTSGLIISDHHPADSVNWGEFATVMNKMLMIIKSPPKY